jgi:hypothetical protein
MKTTDLFSSNRSAHRINESMEKIFGTKLDLASFDLPKLEDARNKIRTQLSQVRTNSGFNENIENEAVTQAQFMLDAINSEIAERQEFIADPHVAEVSMEGYTKFGAYWAEELAKTVFDMNPNLSTDGRADELLDAGYKIAVERVGKKRAQYDFSYDEDFSSDFVTAYGWLQDGGNPETGEDGEEHTRKYGHLFNKGQSDKESSPSAGFGQDESMAMEKAPPGAKAERMVKHIKKGYAKDGKLTDKEKSIAYATAWKQHNKEKNESVNTGDNMTRKLTEGEIQQAQSIVTAKTMVDRVGRWIEELSGMENDTLLQLGDQIRDEMSGEQAKNFISSCAPAIQAALQNLKDTRETLATGVRMLTGEEQGAEMLGGEPGAEGGDEFGGDMGAEPDMMNAGGEEELGGELGGDEFGAADAAAGGLEAAGREQRESIDRSNSLLRVLAG